MSSASKFAIEAIADGLRLADARGQLLLRAALPDRASDALAARMTG